MTAHPTTKTLTPARASASRATGRKPAPSSTTAASATNDEDSRLRRLVRASSEMTEIGMQIRPARLRCPVLRARARGVATGQRESFLWCMSSRLGPVLTCFFTTGTIRRSRFSRASGSASRTRARWSCPSYVSSLPFPFPPAARHLAHMCNDRLSNATTSTTTGDNTPCTSCTATRNDVWVSRRNLCCSLSSWTRKDENPCSCCGDMLVRKTGGAAAITTRAARREAEKAVAEVARAYRVGCCEPAGCI